MTPAPPSSQRAPRDLDLKFRFPGQLGQARQNGQSRAQTPEEYVQRITRLWSEAQAKFLQIGRFLNRARQVYPRGTYKAMIEKNLPFAANTARMLRMVAERYDRIPHDR